MIIGSILLAFGIQAWWDETRERDEESRLLEAVLEDMRANLVLIETNSSYHRAAVAAEREILSLAGQAPSTITLQATDSLIADVSWWFGSAHWHTGALEALTRGGRLEVIRDEELRHTLASWTRIIDEVRLTEDQENEFFDDALMPFMRREAWVPQIADLAQVLPGTDLAPGYGRVNWATETRDHRPLLLSPEFQNLVLHKLWVQVDILSAYEAFSEQLQELIGQVEAEAVPQ